MECIDSDTGEKLQGIGKYSVKFVGGLVQILQEDLLFTNSILDNLKLRGRCNVCNFTKIMVYLYIIIDFIIYCHVIITYI